MPQRGLMLRVSVGALTRSANAFARVPRAVPGARRAFRNGGALSGVLRYKGPLCPYTTESVSAKPGSGKGLQI